MAGAIRVNRGFVAYGLDRNDWASGVEYKTYNDTDTTPEQAVGNSFFVLAGSTHRDIYKCLDNNGGSMSTSKPAHKNTTKVPTKEPDGYIWKYMYSISESQFTKFATTEVIPVYTQVQVSSDAVEGAIYNIVLPSSTGTGQNYRSTAFSNGTNGVFVSNASFAETISHRTSKGALITIQDSANGFGFTPVDYFNNTSIQITSGQSTGTVRKIMDSAAGSHNGTDPSTLRISLNSPITNIKTGDRFLIGPNITIKNDKSGSGFSAIGLTDTTGKITSTIIASPGQRYSNGDMTVSFEGDYVGSDGIDATAEVYLTPSKGHGRVSHFDLGVKYVIVAPETTIAKTENSEQGIFIGPSNEYRQVGLMVNPVVGNTSSYTVAQDASYDMRTHLYFESGASQLARRLQQHIDAGTRDALIVNATTGATGHWWSSDLPSAGAGENTRWLSMVGTHGDFYDGDSVSATVIGTGTNLYGSTISSKNLSLYEYPENSQKHPTNSVMPSQLTKYSGEIIYHENISPVGRRDSQNEQFKFVFEF
jgi:hypothetical protein